MTDKNETEANTEENNTQNLEQTANQIQGSANNVVDNAENLYDSIRHLPKTIVNGLTASYRQEAAAYRQNLSTDTADIATLNTQNQIVTTLSAADAKITAPQMFDDFIKNNYTEQQQQDIKSEISRQLNENNGSCTFVWKDKQEKDSVTAVYQDSLLKNFKLYNEDITEDNYQRQELKFQMKKNNEDAFTLISETKDKALITKGKATHKTTDKIKVKTDGSYVSRSSKTDTITTTNFGQYSITGHKQTAKEKGDQSGIQEKTHTTTQYNIEAGMFALGAGVKGASQSTLYDENGIIKQETTTANAFAVSTHGADVAHQDTQITHNDDGSMAINRNEIHLSMQTQHLAAQAKVEHQKTFIGADGETLADNRVAVSAGLGYGTISGSMETQSLRTDENGNKIAHHNTYVGEVSKHSISAGFNQNQNIVDNSGTTIFQNSTAAGFTASSAGASFKATSLTDVRDTDGRNILHKELSTAASFNTGGTLNINQTSQLQTESTKREKAFNATVDANNLVAKTKSITKENNKDTQKFEASADVKKAELSYNDKKISALVLATAQLQK